MKYEIQVMRSEEEGQPMMLIDRCVLEAANTPGAAREYAAMLHPKPDVAQGAVQELMADLADFNPDNGYWSATDVFNIVVLWANRHGVDADGGVL